METYRVYIRINADSMVTAIDSDAFLRDTEGWIFIDEGKGDRYHHAQGNYLEKRIMTEDGRYRYRYVGGRIVKVIEG